MLFTSPSDVTGSAPQNKISIAKTAPLALVIVNSDLVIYFTFNTEVLYVAVTRYFSGHPVLLGHTHFFLNFVHVVTGEI